jgi:hypothetical protein
VTGGRSPRQEYSTTQGDNWKFRKPHDRICEVPRKETISAFQNFGFQDYRSQEVELCAIATHEITKSEKPKSVVR